MSTWILLATSAKSIIFSLDRGKYQIVKKFVNDKATTRVGEFLTESRTLVRRPAMTDANLPEDRYQEDVERRFGNDIVDFIDKSYHQRKFTSLIIVSSKQFAGGLRNNFSTTLSKVIHQEILKNFYTEKPHELKTFLQSHNPRLAA